MVVISPSAEADLRSIKENIASDKPAAAIKWLDGIHKTFAMIDMRFQKGLALVGDSALHNHNFANIAEMRRWLSK